MAFWDRFFGSAGSQAAGIAIGATAIPALRPAVQFLENEAWKLHPDLPPDAVLLAQGVAQGQVDPASAQEWAAEQGIGGGAFQALVDVANVGPEIGLAFEAWRRGLLSESEFDTALKRTGLEPQWYGAIRGLHDRLLSSPELAMAQQQGFVDAARSNSEAQLQGVTNERQQIRFEMAGLPPGVETGLAMLRRGIIDDATFAQIVREGHTKTKYTGVLTQLRRQLLSAATAVRAHLKGHITADEMHARGAEWGYSAADMDLWYQAEGRPATVHQIHIGYARGATLPGAASERDAVDKAVAQSDIRPEYADLLWAQRYTYPSAFVLRGLTQSGAITTAEAEQILLYSGWEPGLARQVAQFWGGGTTATATSPHVSKADTQAWSALHKAYVGGVASDAEVTEGFSLLGIDTTEHAAVLARWQFERGLERRRLTPAQVKKAYVEAVPNPATGGAWTKDEALAYLVQLGMSAADANTFLEL